MSTLHFAVWNDAREVAIGPPEQEGAITFTTPSAQGAVIVPGDSAKKTLKRVRVICDADAWVTWGENPTAVADGTEGRMMGAENPEYYGIQAGHRIAVIQRAG
ncbi:MAG: hypothetical protein ACPGVG_13385 [Mycobacterium sp.]